MRETNHSAAAVARLLKKNPHVQYPLSSTPAAPCTRTSFPFRRPFRACLVFIQALLEGKHGHDEHAAVGDEGKPGVKHRDVAEPEEGPVLEHELVQEVAVGVEDGHHEPGPL